MKKFNHLIVFSLLFYGISVLFSCSLLFQMQPNQDKSYRVEINRIYAKLTDRFQLQELPFDQYEYVKDVQFLSGSERRSDTIDTFFLEENHTQMLIKPYYDQDGSLVGFLKFIYWQPNKNIAIHATVILSCLSIMEGLFLLYLFNLKKQFIKPLKRLNELPVELAKGHYKGSEEVNDFDYLNQFLWGITQLKDHLDISQKRHLALEKEKKQLLLSLSHDIKTPLNLIKLYSKALTDKIYHTQEEIDHVAHQIIKKAEDIEVFVAKLMKSSREDILQIEVKQGEFYLDDLMHRVLDSYNNIFDMYLIDLCVQPFENRLVIGDIDRVQEVFENLFDNAFKYGDGEKIEISFYEEEYCQLIKIFNTGVVMEEHEIPHVFDSFFRGLNSEGKQGSGLGLYICKEIMHKIDGDIFIQKEENGMAFVLVLRLL